MTSLGNFDVNKSGSSPLEPAGSTPAPAGSTSGKDLNQEKISQIKGSKIKNIFASKTQSSDKASSADGVSDKRIKGRSLFARIWARLPGNSARAEKAASRAAANQIAKASQEAKLSESEPDVDIDKLSNDILNVNRKNDNEVTRFLGDVKGLRVEVERLTQDTQKRVKASTAALAEATPDNKAHLAEVLDRDQKTMEMNLKKIEELEGKLKAAAAKFKEYKTILQDAGKPEAAKKVDLFLQVIEDSGEVIVDISKLNKIYNESLPASERIMFLLPAANGLRSQTWEENNLLRSPLHQEGVDKTLVFYDELAETMQNDENKELIKGLGKCLTKTQAALDEFHAVKPGEKSMQETIGKLDRVGGKSLIQNQDLSALNLQQLQTLEDKANKLKNAINAIHDEMRALTYKAEGEPLFKALSGVYGYLEIQLSALDGESTQTPGNAVRPAFQTSQIEILLGLVKEAKEKNDLV